MTELDDARYILLSTYKRDGSAVSSPVWITGVGGTYAFTTARTAWKVKRLGRNSAVEAVACDMRGKVKPGATRYSGTAEVVTSADALSSTQRALAAKYGLQWKVVGALNAVKSRFGRSPDQELVAIQLALHPTEPTPA